VKGVRKRERENKPKYGKEGARLAKRERRRAILYPSWRTYV